MFCPTLFYYKLRMMNDIQSISVFDYIALKVPNDAYMLLNKYGNYQKAQSPRELSNQIREFVRVNGEKGLKALGTIHPDKELIAYGSPSNSQEYSNLSGGCGCGGGVGFDGKKQASHKPCNCSECRSQAHRPNYRNVEGDGIKQSSIDLLLGGSILLIALSLIIHKK